MWQDNEFVFTSTIGTPLDGDNVYRAFREILTTAGVRTCRFHDLRHCCASLLIAQGVPARVVMEVLGHSNISLTLNTYTHILPPLRQVAADRMDEALGWTP